MGLSASLAIASSGLAAIQAEMAVASQNVANASTAGYAIETSSISSRTAGGQAGGVLVGLTGRTIDIELEASLYAQNAAVSAFTTTKDGLTTVSALQGSTSSDSGSSSTLSDQVGNLQTSLITLEADPSNSAGQQAVVTAADTLASNINVTAQTYQRARQSAQESILDEVSSVNSGLALIGSLSKQIGQDRITGINTADLENQRSGAMTTLSNLISVKFRETPSGEMLVTTADGLSLPTHAASGPLSTSDAIIGVNDAYPVTIPAISINGRDVTLNLSSGKLGANISLRDQILPTMQAELDSFSRALASRFDSQGLTLFTDGNGNVPGNSTVAVTPMGQLGFANAIQVNPTIQGNASIVRDGSHNVNGSSSGASSFTVNAGRGASDTTLINRLLDYALGPEIQSGVAQPAADTTGLGVTGTLSASYSGTNALAELASNVTSAQASTINDATTKLADAAAIQSSLAAQRATISGVSIDSEMSSLVTLQNAYAANAKIVNGVQTMFAALLAAVV